MKIAKDDCNHRGNCRGLIVHPVVEAPTSLFSAGGNSCCFACGPYVFGEHSCAIRLVEVGKPAAELHATELVVIERSQFTVERRGIPLGDSHRTHFAGTTSGAYKLAVATAHQTREFNEALGAPITEGWFSQGKIVWGNPVTAELVIPVRGKLRKGNLQVLAIKDSQGWRLTELTLELTQPDEQIDLLPKSGRSDLEVGRP